MHKLALSQLRDVTGQAKARKDLEQSAQLLGALCDDRPGDLRLAWEDLQAHRWLLRRVQAARARLVEHAPEVARRFAEVVGTGGQA